MTEIHNTVSIALPDKVSLENEQKAAWDMIKKAYSEMEKAVSVWHIRYDDSSVVGIMDMNEDGDKDLDGYVPGGKARYSSLKKLNRQDMKEFSRELQEYMDFAVLNDLDESWRLELENAMIKETVSRHYALKIRLIHRMMTLLVWEKEQADKVKKDVLDYNCSQISDTIRNGGGYEPIGFA